MVEHDITETATRTLKGRTLWVPRMTYSGARAFCAAFRSVGIDAEVVPEGDHRTLELGYKFAGGEECLPEIVTLGNFMKIIEQPNFHPIKTAFFMPLSGGPCRFGQYTPFLRKVLRQIGHEDVLVLSPTSKDGYEGVGDVAGELMRTGFRALIGTDLLRKMLLRYRPYELTAGDTDEVHHSCLDDFCAVVERLGRSTKEKLAEMRGSLIECRDKFRKIPAFFELGRPFIGIVGEIYCRLNTFSNEQLVRQLESKGAECWISDLTEWIFYVNHQKIIDLKFEDRGLSLERLKTEIRDKVQRRDEHAFVSVFEGDFQGMEEPHSIAEMMEYATPYLRPGGALGEMIMSVGKAVYYQRMGCDGIVDISPFTCMNGIVSESVYPRVSEDYDNIPVRSFYFDGKMADRQADVEIFVELARTYQRRKKIPRSYPPEFDGKKP
jgi:predicted nucleotide-binding protein (sugar kinase/HSP70/actin superfamily)